MANACPNCGKLIEDLYCTHCGEKILTEKDRALGVLLSEATENLFNFDSKLFRTLGYLIIKPGFLTLEYWKGRRIRYLKPFQLLILLNLFYFFSAYTAHNLNFNFSVMVPSLEEITHNRIFSTLAFNIVENKVNSSQINFDDYNNKFNSHLEDTAKSLVILLVPIVALFFWLIHIRQHFLYHIIAASHLVSFYIFLASCYLLIGSIINFYITPVSVKVITYLPISLLLIYLFISLKTVYERSIIFTAVYALLFVFVGIAAITNLYDMILFFVVYVIV
jgi:Protein of unknown function (DUF3667)